MANESSWFPMTMFDKKAKGILFGPCLQNESSNVPYKNEFIKKNETVIWNPKLHKTISLKSYEKAHLEDDIEALDKIADLGIPLGCTFGGTLKWKKPHEFIEDKMISERAKSIREA